MRKIFIGLLVLTALTLGVTPASATGQSWCQSQANLGVIGDSISAGWELPGTPTGQDNPTNPLIWVNTVTSNYGAHLHNYAHSGAMASDFLPGGQYNAALDTSLAADNDNLVIIELGTNELGNGVPAATWQTNLTALISLVHTYQPAASVAVMMPYYWWGNTPAWQAQMSASASVASATGSIQFMTHLPLKYAAPGNDPVGLLNPAPDIHLNAAGQAVLGGAAMYVLQPCLRV